MDYNNGNKFYDESEVFETYLNHRKWNENPNKVIEQPIFLELLSKISGNVLDLGCGYGGIVNKLLELEIEKYTGIDASIKMIEHGKSQIKDSRVKFIQSDIESWEFGKSNYSWIISSLVFHYLLDLEDLFAKIHTGLEKDGRLVFSVEHPIITSSIDLPRKQEKKQNWNVDNYFELGKRKQDWMSNHVIKYHRTIEEYWSLLTNLGFRVEEIKEGCPDRKKFQSEVEYERRKKIPIFLIIKAIKL